MSRAGSVSRPEVSQILGPEVSQSLGPEVSRDRTWFAAGSVLELLFLDLCCGPHQVSVPDQVFGPDHVNSPELVLVKLWS